MNATGSDKLPLAIEIEISHACNKACSYCPNSQYKRVEQGSMKVALFEKIMGQLQEIRYQGRISYHFYNEPLLSSNLDLFVKITRQYLPECHIELYTNGTLLDLDRLNALFTLGVNKFSVTDHVGVDLTKLKETCAKLPESKQNQIRIMPLDTLMLSNRGGLVNVGKPISEPLKRPCFIPRCVMVVTLNGNVVPCYEDYHQLNAMGNVEETHIRDIWNSEKYSQFRVALAKGIRERYETCNRCNNTLIIV